MQLYTITNAIIEAQHETVDTEQLDALQIAFQDKSIACACVIKNLSAEVNAIESELKRLQDLKATRQNNVDRLKAYILANMKAAGLSKVENGVHSLRIAQSPLSITVTDEASVPVEFKIEEVNVKIDRQAIAEQIKRSGEIPEGIQATQGEHLRIS